MSGRALIIDKDTTFADYLATALSHEGYAVQTCDTGREGIEHAKTGEPNLIILCVELEDTSGYSICAKIKKDNRLKDIPLVITSERATQETFEHHKKLKTRAQAYLMKPFEPADLLAHLKDSVISNSCAPRSPSLPPPLPQVTGSIDLPEIGLEPMGEDAEPSVVSDDISADFERTMASISQSLQESMNINGIGSGVKLREDFDEDEIRTTIGELPASMLPPVPTTGERVPLSSEDGDLSATRSRLFEVERERDDALARAHSLRAQLEALSKGIGSAPATSGDIQRELISVKKEINAKERELLELRDSVQTRDRQLLEAKEHQADLEERILRSEEEQAKSEQARVEAEGRIAGAEARAEQIELSSKTTILGLQEELLTVREALEVAQKELKESRDEGELVKKERDEDRERLNQQVQFNEELEQQIADFSSELEQSHLELTQSRTDVERTQGELEQSRTELEQSRVELEQSRAAESRLTEELDASQQYGDGLKRRLDASELEVRNNVQVMESMRRQQANLERQLNEARQRHHEEADVRDKARRAIEIGLNLLAEVDYTPEPSSFESEVMDNDEEENANNVTDAV